MARNTTALKNTAQPTVEQPAAPEGVSVVLDNIAGETVLEHRKEPVDLPRQPSNARSRGPLISEKSIFTQVTEERRSSLELRSEVVKSTSQVFAHAADLYSEGDDKAKEAKTIADKAAIQLCQARAAGVLTAEQASEVLRNAFGAQKKGARQIRVHPTDPEASKTPFGPGEDIRKRIVRAANAYEHINGLKEDRFFEGLDGDSADDDGNTLREVVDGVLSGTVPIWGAYEQMAAIKRAHQVRTNPAFDAKKIAAIVNALSEAGARDIILANTGLKIVYAELINVLAIIGEVDEETE